MLVGADDFHRRFGWYAERANRGEKILVTRRGKPYLRILPVQDPLPAAA